MALAWRAADHIVERMRSAGDLMDRRTTLKWMLAAAAASPLWNHAAPPARRSRGRLRHRSRPGEGLSRGDALAAHAHAHPAEAAAALCATIIPRTLVSPSAAEVGVQLFIDEWVSAPYPRHADDRKLVVEGLAWIDAESRRRFGRRFAAASEAQKATICDAICEEAKAEPRNRKAARILRALPRPHGGRLLHHAARHEGLGVRRQHAVRELRRTTSGSAEKCGSRMMRTAGNGIGPFPLTGCAMATGETCFLACPLRRPHPRGLARERLARHLQRE
jgi:hypothetical protein